MDRTLDEIVSERQRNGPRGRRGGRRNDRNDFPRDGIRKVQTAPPSPSQMLFEPRQISSQQLTRAFLAITQSNRDEPRNLDSEWVHDKYEDNTVRRPAHPARRRSPGTIPESGLTKLRVENLHYDLTEDDLDDLFNRIGPVAKLSLLYDRAGRSEGTAFVTYESAHDAKRAIREFDGANANGQPIRLIAVPTGPARARNPFDTAVLPPRPLAERITRADNTRSRSTSPVRHTDVSGPTPAGIDRYIPGQGNQSRSPAPRRREGRPPGARRERGERSGRARDGGGGGGTRRPKKTQEELDAEMEDYWGGGGAKESEEAGTAASAEPEGDIEMAE